MRILIRILFCFFAFTFLFAQAKVNVPQLLTPAKEAANESKSLDAFLRESVNEYSKEQQRLALKENDLDKIIKGNASSEEKRKMAINYLNNKLNILDKMIADFEFVNTKLNDKINTMNSLVGGIGKNQSIAQKQAQSSANVKSLVNDINKYKLQLRDLNSQRPETGSVEFDTWRLKTRELNRNFYGAVEKLKINLQQEFIYTKIAEGLNISKAKAASWTDYTADLGFIFDINQLKLESSREMTKSLLDYYNAIDVFQEGADLGAFAKEIGNIIGDLSSKIPPMIGDFEIPDAPELFTDVVSPIEFDPDKFIEEFRKELTK